jgi:WD40 repeat protein
VLLSGHTGEIQCIKFSKDGNILASAGFDQHIYLWDIFN